MTTTLSSSNTFRFGSSIDLCNEPKNGAFGAGAQAASAALKLCGGGGRAVGGRSEDLSCESEAAGAGRARFGGAGGEIVWAPGFCWTRGGADLVRDGAAGEFADLDALREEGIWACEEACVLDDEVLIVLADRFDEVVGVADWVAGVRLVSETLVWLATGLAEELVGAKLLALSSSDEPECSPINSRIPISGDGGFLFVEIAKRFICLDVDSWGLERIGPGVIKDLGLVGALEFWSFDILNIRNLLLNVMKVSCSKNIFAIKKSKAKWDVSIEQISLKH